MLPIFPKKYKISSTQGFTIQSGKIAIAQVKIDHCVDCNENQLWRGIIYFERRFRLKKNI